MVKEAPNRLTIKPLKPYLFEIIRGVTILVILVGVIAASFFSILYGTPSALAIREFKVISPLEWLLISLGTRTVFIDLLVPALIFILIIVVFGRFLCGWICPVGLLLDYSHHLTLQKNKNKWGALRKNPEKYIILIAVLAASLLFNVTLPYLFAPPTLMYRLITSIVIQGVIGADLVILLLIFILDIAALRYDRTWCNTLCPLGTLVSSLSFINIIQPRVHKKTCTNCLVCERVCPMRIPLLKTNNWFMMACTKCFKCWEKCPVNAIKIKLD